MVSQVSVCSSVSSFQTSCILSVLAILALFDFQSTHEVAHAAEALQRDELRPGEEV